MTARPARSGGVRRAAVVLLLGLGALLLGTGPANAHAVLSGSDPAAGSSLSAGPATVSLTFDEGLQQTFAALTVVGPDGGQWAREAPTVAGDVLSAPVGELGAAGDYTIAYRVTSADGHPVSGTVPFTLTEAGSGTPASTVAATADDGGIPVWPFVVGAVVVLGGGLALVLRGGRRAGRA